MMALGQNPTNQELKEMTHAYADPDSNGILLLYVCVLCELASS